MNKLLTTAITVSAGVALAASAVSPAYAWHPKGQITKSVQNVTAGTNYSDANTADTAVSAKPGDVLNYRVTVKNVAPAADKNYNDMNYITLSDTLPAGVELVDQPSKRVISEKLNDLKPGQSHTKTYKVKVTSEKDNDVITNKACYEGDSAVKDNKQSGCDTAVVKVTVPETPVTPEAPAPEAPVEQPTELPKTGVSEAILPISLLTVVAGYAAYLVSLKRRASAE